MKQILFVLIVASGCAAQAQTNLTNVGDINFADIGGLHEILTASDDALQVQSGSIALVSGSEVLIQSGGDGAFLIQSSNTSDITVNAGGNVVLWPGAGDFATVVYSGLQISPQSAQPTCDASHRGTIYYNAADTGVEDTVVICVKHADDTYSWSDM